MSLSNNCSGTYELATDLTEAIHKGDLETAQNIVAALSNLQTKLNINVVNEQEVQESFQITVHVEDRESSGASFKLRVKSTDTIGDLKNRVFDNFGFPVQVQRWIIGRRLPDDDTVSLAKYKVNSPTTVFLYLVSAQSVGHTCDNNQLQRNCVGDDFELLPRQSSSRSRQSSSDERATNRISSSQGHKLEPEESFEDEESSLSDNGAAARFPWDPDENSPEQEQEQGWNCEHCTYENEMSRTSCEMCFHPRPGKASSMTAPNEDIPRNPSKSDSIELTTKLINRLREEFNRSQGYNTNQNGSNRADSNTNIRVGDRVVWVNGMNSESGTVRWIGPLPDGEQRQIIAGVEFDRPVGTCNGKYKNQQLFECRPNHASFVAVDVLVKESHVNASKKQNALNAIGMF